MSYYNTRLEKLENLAKQEVLIDIINFAIKNNDLFLYQFLKEKQKELQYKLELLNNQNQ